LLFRFEVNRHEYPFSVSAYISMRGLFRKECDAESLGICTMNHSVEGSDPQVPFPRRRLFS
jgi:hypothetical protein